MSPPISKNENLAEFDVGTGGEIMLDSNDFMLARQKTFDAEIDANAKFSSSKNSLSFKLKQ